MYSSFSEIKQALNSGTTNCVEIVKGYLEKIKAHSALNLFLEVYQEEAINHAEEVDKKIASGNAGRLAGMVVGLKDVICYAGHKVQASSKILDGFESQYSATVVERLLAEDAIIIGRQNCDEFAMGSSNENSAFGPAFNPHGENTVPGGSSGASAAAVAAGLCTVSLGSDTGGSVRQPAAFCGIVGLKPTYSRISRHGLIAYASSFDIIGVLASTTTDAALVLEVIAGADDFDATVSHKEVPAYVSKLTSSENKKYKIGYLQEAIGHSGLQEEIKYSTKQVIESLTNNGHQVEEVEFPLLKYALPTYYILTTAEASTNLSRFDGVRYGYRNQEAETLEELYKLSRTEGFGEEVRRRILLGTFALSASYYDAYFTKAQKVRKLIQQQTQELLAQYDFLLVPTTPTTAFEAGTVGEENPLEMYLADLFTVQANVAGIPAISLPIAKDKKGLPIGIQLMTGAFQEEKLLSFSHHLESIGLFEK